MRLYNPIVGGKRIIENNFDLDIDKDLEVDEKLGKDMIYKYPFLVDLDDKEQQPEGVSEVREIELQNSQYSYRDSSRLIDSIKEQALKTRKTLKETRIGEVCEKLDTLVNISKVIAKREHRILGELQKANRNIFQKIIDKFRK